MTVDDLAVVVEEGFKGVNKRFDGIESNIKDIRAHLDGIENNLKDIRAHLAVDGEQTNVETVRQRVASRPAQEMPFAAKPR